MKLASLFFLSTLSLAACKPTVYLIRHGEKPEEGNGLNAEGEQRAQCLRSVFGHGSAYNIGHIMAQTPQKDGKRQRPRDTVQPLAEDLGLEVDISCDRDDPKCVKKVIKNYEGEGNILICWQHEALKDIAKKLGAKHVDDYPEDRFDVIWTLPPDYKEITAEDSENCRSLDL